MQNGVCGFDLSAESQNPLRVFGRSRLGVDMAPKELEMLVLLRDAEERSRTVRCFGYF